MLSRAAELVGGENVIAKRLGVTPARLDLWLAGAETIPMWVFLELVDILLGPPGATTALRPNQPADPRRARGAT